MYICIGRKNKLTTGGEFLLMHFQSYFNHIGMKY